MIQGVQTQQLTAVHMEQMHDGTAVATCELLSQLAPHAKEASIVRVTYQLYLFKICQATQSCRVHHVWKLFLDHA